MQVLQMSAEGRRKLKAREGQKLKAYRDSKGIWTIGVGHTASAGQPFPVAGMVISEDESDRILMKDLKLFERAINEALRVPVSQNEFDALVSVAFNVGPKFAHSTAMDRLNAGASKQSVADAFLMWKIPPEIIGRRRTEVKQFLTPYGVPEPAPAVATPAPAAIPAWQFWRK